MSAKTNRRIAAARQKGRRFRTSGDGFDTAGRSYHLPRLNLGVFTRFMATPPRFHEPATHRIHPRLKVVLGGDDPVRLGHFFTATSVLKERNER